ncbi:MAG: papain-like cysteine protease family protein [Eubacteriales bacterium]|nr:papain-like cysteine protease family protein [Eubacteriales bacterium]
MLRGTKEKDIRAGKNSRKKRLRRKRRNYLLAGVILLVAVFSFAKLYHGRTIMTSAGPLPKKDYPASMIEFMEKYPQATQFVLDYPKKKNLHRPIDISGEVRRGEIPLFMQWDERWGYETYGDDFLGVNGCGPTTLSMVQCGLTGDTYWNPYEVARMADEQGYYVAGVGSSWDLMTSGARALGLNVHNVECNADAIINALQSGMILICSMGPGDFTYTGHFVALTGTDAAGNITVRDCNSRENSARTWTIEELLPQIVGLWGYSYQA